MDSFDTLDAKKCLNSSKTLKKGMKSKGLKLPKGMSKSDFHKKLVMEHAMRNASNLMRNAQRRAISGMIARNKQLHSKNCGVCGKFREVWGKCSKCEEYLCINCAYTCPKCGKINCKIHSIKCEECGKRFCKDHVSKCPLCNLTVCKEDISKEHRPRIEDPAVEGSERTFGQLIGFREVTCSGCKKKLFLKDSVYNWCWGLGDEYFHRECWEKKYLKKKDRLRKKKERQNMERAAKEGTCWQDPATGKMYSGLKRKNTKNDKT